jgi:anti-anti-sigma regulatory factor
VTPDTENDRLASRDGKIRLPAKADLAVAPALHAQLKHASGDVVLDASEVKVLTTPVLQVLLSAANTFREKGGSLSLDPISKAAETCLAELGIEPDAFSKGASVEGGTA